MEIKTFAPIIIPTLHRYEHFKRCVESLAKCTHADKTELIIGLDFPPSEKYVDGWKRISEYIPSITGFGKITIFKRECNYGSTKNNRGLKDYARQYYDRYINVEDDNVFSPNFLDYINKGLETYKDDPKVYAICGYNYSEIDITDYEYEYYFSHEINAWGWGRWFNEKCDNVLKEVKRPDFLIKLAKNVPFTTFLKDGLKRCNLFYEIGRDFRGDSYYTFYEWNYDMYCMFPKLSLVRNYGQDGTGVHCDNTRKEEFENQPIDDRLTFNVEMNLPVCYNKYIRKKFLKFQTGSFLSKSKKFVLLILMKLFIKLRGY